MTFKTVFDVSQNGFATAFPPFFGLILVAVGALLVFMPDLMQRLMPRGLQGTARTIFSWVFFIFASLVIGGSFIDAYLQYRAAVSDLSAGRYSVIEGPVTNFDPMLNTGHSEESFTVNGHRFLYTDRVVTPGFHNAASHGGPIRESLYVGITYSGNLILRLEVAQ